MAHSFYMHSVICTMQTFSFQLWKDEKEQKGSKEKVKRIYVMRDSKKGNKVKTSQKGKLWSWRGSRTKGEER